MNFINIINNSIGFFMLLSSIILLFITVNFAAQIKKNSDIACTTVMKIGKLREAELENRTTVKHNYISMLNSELQSNTMHMIGILDFLQNSNLPIKSLRNFEEETSIQDTVWNLINIEAAKYFSIELMQQLVNYYSAIANRKIVNNDSSTLHIPFVMQQISIYINCIKLMEAEIGRELDKQPVFDKAIEALNKYNEN